MPLDNMATPQFSPADVASLKGALQVINAVLANVQIVLTPQERKRYGRIHEKKKLLVNKVRAFRDAQPNLSAPDVDWTEFESDYQARAMLSGLITQLAQAQITLIDVKTLHDYDNHQAALRDYAYTKYKAESGNSDYEVKHRETRQFFPRTGKRGKKKEKQDKKEGSKGAL